MPCAAAPRSATSIAQRSSRSSLRGRPAGATRSSSRGPLPVTGQPRLAEMAGALGAVVESEAIFVQRTELAVAQSGLIDPLGFSWSSTVPVKS